MTESGYTHISMVLDRSGSMSSIINDTIGGFNTFLGEQKKQEGKCTLSLMQFDDKHEQLETFKDIQEVKELDSKVYVPRGSTALLDAIGTTIAVTKEEIEKMNEKDRPDKVLFVISTDGEENASREYDLKQINELITKYTEENKWQFIFLGANQDAIQSGNRMGFISTNSMTYTANDKGIDSMYKTLSRKAGKLRGLHTNASVVELEDAVAFDAADRLEQENAK